ncbi:hypothetical protein QOT17_022659 [Balamuthia mandrillaris]
MEEDCVPCLNPITQLWDCAFDGCAASFKHKRSGVKHFKLKHSSKPMPCFTCEQQTWHFEDAKQALLNCSSSRTDSTDPLRRNRMRAVSIPLVLQELLNEYKTWEGQRYVEYITELIQVSVRKTTFSSSSSSSVTSSSATSSPSSSTSTTTAALKRKQPSAGHGEVDWTNETTIQRYFPMFFEIGYCDPNFKQVRKKMVEEFSVWLTQTALNHQDVARQNKLLRNSLDYLVEHNRWISYTELLEVHERMEKEVWKPLLEKAL